MRSAPGDGAAVRMGITPEVHYPWMELSMSNGTTNLVSLGVYPTQAAGG